MNRFHSLRSWAMGFVLVVMLTSTFITGAIFLTMNILPIPGFSLLLMPIAPLVSSMLLGTVLAYIASVRFLDPLQQLTNAIRTVSEGDYSTRVREDIAGGELQEALASFNQMTEELQSTELLRSDFINTFSHEFKTPIVSIRGFARQLQRDDLTEEQRREYVDIIAAESDRLANMSSNILLLTKLENMQIVTDRAPYLLDEQLRNCVLLLEAQWEEKEIEWDLDLPEITFVGNQEMVSHVWINLLSNAIKFTPRGGTISVRLQRKKDDYVVTIRDQGPGMDQTTMDHIFEKFYQGDASHFSKGNGLGLPLVKRIVELCRGNITVESEIGKGSAFIISLPAVEEENGK